MVHILTVFTFLQCGHSQRIGYAHLERQSLFLSNFGQCALGVNTGTVLPDELKNVVK